MRDHAGKPTLTGPTSLASARRRCAVRCASWRRSIYLAFFNFQSHSLPISTRCLIKSASLGITGSFSNVFQNSRARITYSLRHIAAPHGLAALHGRSSRAMGKFRISQASPEVRTIFANCERLLCQHHPWQSTMEHSWGVRRVSSTRHASGEATPQSSLGC